MSMKSICLTGVAIAALVGGAVTAQAASKAEEDAITRQLNLDQLEKARSGADTQAPTPAESAKPDGQGGPELQGPPKPDEGMTDEKAKPEESAPAPEEEEEATPPEKSEEKTAPPSSSPY